MLFSDLEQLVKQAMATTDVAPAVKENAAASDADITTKLAETLESADAGNSRLGVAMLLTAIDILSD